MGATLVRMMLVLLRSMACVLLNLEPLINGTTRHPRGLTARHVFVLHLCYLRRGELRRHVNFLEDCHNVRARTCTHVRLLVFICVSKFRDHVRP